MRIRRVMASNSVFAVIVSLLGVASFAACTTKAATTSSNAEDADSDTGNGKRSASDDDDDDNDGGDASLATDEDAGDESASCEDETTSKACISCCNDTFPDGRKAYNTIWTACFCSHCATECASTFCGTPQKQANAACEKCLTTIPVAQDCPATFEQECAADSDCAAHDACLNTTCKDKP